MNKTLLLFIVDFLFLNLIALTRWEKATPTRTSQPPVPQVASNAATKDQDLVEVMRESLADEQAARQNLAQELATQSGTLSQRERSLAQAAAERAHLAASLAEDQKAQADLSQKFAAASHQATLTREQLERLQHELDEKRTETDRQKRQLAELEKQQAFSHKQIEGLTVAVMVDEQEKKNLQGEAVQLQGQVRNERAERLEVEQAATQLAQGVGQLAQNSGELSKEIRENRPINANVLFDDFLNNRVEATVELRRRGLLGQSVHSRAAPMVLTTDGHQVYAVAYGGDVGFSLDQIGTDWEKLQISLARPPAAPSVAGELRFLAVDPRVIAIPVEPAQVSALGAKVYPLAQDRFKFPEAVLIDAKGKGYGDVGFKLDPDHPGYVRVDNHLLKHLLGDFAPSPGDLVMSKSGELLGVMVNRDYCALMGNFSPIAALHAGDIASEHSGAIVDSLGARVRAMPYELQ